MTERELPQVDQIWENSRNRHTYYIIDLPKWSDTPGQADSPIDLETWVYMRNTTTGLTYTRSMESFLGTNRNGEPRFTRVR